MPVNILVVELPAAILVRIDAGGNDGLFDFGAIPAFIILFVNSDIIFGSMSANILAVSIVYLSAHILDAVVIIPVVVAKIVDLHPVTVIVVIILDL